jgi:hypothetical protein
MPGLTIECPIVTTAPPRARTSTPVDSTPSPAGRVPKVARWLALAHQLEALREAGQVDNQSQLAALARVTRARVSQIMNLLNLAPDIQDALLHLHSVAGRAPVILAQLQPIASTLAWPEQRRQWQALLS